MSAVAEISVFTWPQYPPLPPVGEAVLVCVPIHSTRATARLQIRTATREILAAWSGVPPARVRPQETSCGPLFPDLIDGTAVAVSFSYAEDTAWIGLVRGGAIGVDALRVRAFAEMDSVAKLYLDPQRHREIQTSASPALAFTLAWTEFEARLKCLRRGLSERASGRHPLSSPSACTRVRRINDFIVSVVTA